MITTTIYNETLKKKIKVGKQFNWKPLSLCSDMIWIRPSRIHEWPEGYWIRHCNINFFSVQLILDGELTISSENVKQTVKAGEAVLIPPGNWRLATGTGGPCRKIYFIPSGIMFQAAANRLHFDHLAVLRNIDVQDFYRRMENICDLFDNHSEESENDVIKCSHLTYELILYVADKVHHSGFPQILSNCLEYIRTRISENLSLEILSDHLNISQTTIKELFKRHLHTSPGQYIIQTRLDYAKELLLTTDNSIKSVAYMCGYNNPLYFSNAFKKQFGKSPRALRCTAGSGLL